MTQASPALPAPILRGLECARESPGCELDGEPTYDEARKRWIVTLWLQLDNAGPSVDARTKWRVLFDPEYPLGRISFYPSVDHGLTGTFPHQERNVAPRDATGWRTGKLCLDSPFRGERLCTDARDPVGDEEARLQWYVRRALQWLKAAAEGTLLATGDPFEIPAVPSTGKKEWRARLVVHDESPRTVPSWTSRLAEAGHATFGTVSGLENAIGVVAFTDRHNSPVRTWGGRPLESRPDGPSGYWWLWPGPIVLPPWHAPGTWGELRVAGAASGIHVDRMLKRFAPILRGSKHDHLLLLGYPIPTRVGSAPNEVHWNTLLLPRLPSETGKPPPGFRPNAIGWWKRDRRDSFADDTQLEYVDTENWSSDRLQARGRFPEPVRGARIAIIGLGALGSAVAELLARGGASSLALFDPELLASGNICRHTLTLASVGRTKVRAVAARLREVSPFVSVTEFEKGLFGDARQVTDALDPFDVVIDCSGSDVVLALLESGWWSIPRVFASFSMGYRGKRLFSFSVRSNRFPRACTTSTTTPR